jgi:polyhydroxyalkanoate synthesis regulator phasin|tara:strand:- start:668 stop:1102 length:435 start_codon:yes stop_codon:yes gene_type:complete
METNMMILAGLGLIVSAVATWWYKNKGNVLKKVADELEDRIEDLTGVDIELDSVIDDVVSAAESVADEVHESVVDSLESGDSLEEVVSDAKTAGEEALDNVDIDVDALKSLTVSALKERLKAAGLPVSGKKADLIARLITASSK